MRAPRRCMPVAVRSTHRRRRRHGSLRDLSDHLYRGGMFGGMHRGVREVPTRPADPAVRRANLKRIARLFSAYRRRLGAVLSLILVSAGLGVIPAFLLRGV